MRAAIAGVPVKRVACARGAFLPLQFRFGDPLRVSTL
jgi:hypothetical protein